MYRSHNVLLHMPDDVLCNTQSRTVTVTRHVVLSWQFLWQAGSQIPIERSNGLSLGHLKVNSTHCLTKGATPAGALKEGREGIGSEESCKGCSPSCM